MKIREFDAKEVSFSYTCTCGLVYSPAGGSDLRAASVSWLRGSARGSGPT